MRILIVEDDSMLADALAGALGDAGYAADVLASGEDADRALATETFDLAILDIGLPQLDGFEVLRRLRARGLSLPVLILTARKRPHDRIYGLDLGADDYLSKPFVTGELLARVRALLRRAQGRAGNAIAVGPLVVDVAGCRATLGDAALDLSSRELAAIEVLAERAGKVVSKSALLSSVYSWDKDVGPNAIEIIVHRLRRKLHGSGIAIRTVRGLGYLLEEDAPVGEGPDDGR
jgi:two-component system, OmpR family, response regulator